MYATESPMAGVGASERSTMPNGTPRRFEASRATSWPTRVILNAVFLMISAISASEQSPARRMADATTPGPDTPTLMTVSGSPRPWNAPAMKGLSSGAFAKTTSLAQPMDPRSAVSSAVRRTTRPISATASMLMPALVEATFTDEQTSSVLASASGMDSMSTRLPSDAPFCTSAL